MMIRIRELTHDYPDGTEALKGVDLDVAENEFAGLIGRNGAGKSTLLLHLNGLLKARTGTILVDGLPFDGNNLRKIRRKVGIVFQNPDDMLFSATVYDDVAFGPKNMGMDEAEVKKAVHESLSIVGIAGLEDRNPHHLSIGQKKRVSIAAIIAMKPEVIVFDEPTSHLDARGKKEIMDLIISLKCTKIMSTHDLELVKHCDKVYIMDEGRIVYSGTRLNENVLLKHIL